MRTIVRTTQADEDLISIWQYVAAHDPTAADRLLDSIEHRWIQLVLFPLSGVAREDIAAGIRQLVASNYLILYRVSETTIEILRVVHGRRRIDEGIVRRL